MKLICFAFLLPFCGMASAQSAGRIVFEEKMDLHVNLPPDRQQYKDMIPQFNSAGFELVFSGDESLYRAKKEEEVTEATSGRPGGGTMTMRFGRENREIYKHLADDVMIDSRDFMQKQFLITGPPTPRKWKMGKNQKEILGYNCMDAHFRIDSARTVTAWFAPQLAVSNGPSDYQGLPGMILQVDIDNGHRTITATEITFDGVDTSVIVAPKKGKKVTSEEFEKIREEKMKEMGIQRGSGGPGVMIHTITTTN